MTTITMPLLIDLLRVVKKVLNSVADAEFLSNSKSSILFEKEGVFMLLPPHDHDLASALSKAQASLGNLTQTLQSPAIDATRALSELFSANESLGKALKILILESQSEAPLEKTFLEPQIQALKDPMHGLFYGARIVNSLNKIFLLCTFDGQRGKEIANGTFLNLCELAQLRKKDLLQIPACGRGTIDDIESELQRRGLKLGMTFTLGQLTILGARKVEFLGREEK